MTAGLFDVYLALARLGRADAQRDALLAADEQLWAAAHALDPDRFPADAVDPVELGDLRGAYDDGRRRGWIDLDRLAALIRERGIPAEVRDSSGGTAVIYIGEPYTDPLGETRQLLVAGPGMFMDGNRAFADREEFSIGPGARDAVLFEPDPDRFQTLAEIADCAVAAARAETDWLNQVAARVDAAVRAGVAAFWTAVRTALPGTASNAGLVDDTAFEQTEQDLHAHVWRIVSDNLPVHQLDAEAQRSSAPAPDRGGHRPADHPAGRGARP